MIHGIHSVSAADPQISTHLGSSILQHFPYVLGLGAEMSDEEFANL